MSDTRVSSRKYAHVYIRIIFNILFSTVHILALAWNTAMGTGNLFGNFYFVCSNQINGGYV